ncbi:hypothetical protein G6011_08393 [Alternaria panax]|uniref:Uncharacterized protein n=1 Tax=Alternaria panax TaxID=48097 RepID=A0AAD4I624_9PLEO|nr:hypothetical protein G6011_08393 [Alternaria panax]
MDSLPRPFTIEVDGKPIAKVNGPLDEESYDGQTCKHAKTGSEPAIFELKQYRLISDGLVLSRELVEDLTLKPKRVYWFRADTYPVHHRVIAGKDGNNFSLQMSGSTLMADGDTVFACLLREQAQKVIVKMQA